MNSLRTLTLLFLKQLICRKWLWIVIVIFASMMLFNYIVQARMERTLGEGVSYDIATRQAASELTSTAANIRAFSVFFVLIVSALVAPASRRDGTTQFVLTLPVSRFKTALAQYAALSVFVLISVLIVHAGYVIAALKFGFMSKEEIALAWILLLIPLMFYSAVIFSLSLAHPAILTYIVFIAIPSIFIGLAEFGIKESADKVPMIAVRFIDNVRLLFPDVDGLILWPKLSPGIAPPDPPFPDWTWQIAHVVLCSFFWILLGLWFYRNYDFGSRTAVK
jgi:hypothetical protein